MSESQCRYDEIADWYVDYTRGLTSEPIALLSEDLSGQRVLDMACGYGRATRHIAELGARMTGVDSSSKLLAHARAAEAERPLGIR
jgi:2-polyprenyl-3-methyl-5-hydroxy-6-metoxy-1,4-benzoquinol methylase